MVEVDVHGEMEEEASVRDEEEETKVEEAAPAGGGGGERLAQGADGVEGGDPLGPAMAPGSRGWPPLPNLDTPLLVALESPVWTLRFLLVRVHHRLLGAGRWVWVDGGGGGCPPGQAPTPGGGPRVVGVAT